MMMPFQYAEDPTAGTVTALAGLPAFFELATMAGFRESVERRVGAANGAQGWTDWEMVASLLLLNLAGGDCVDDLERLEGDAGLGRVMLRLRFWGLSRRERRAAERRWRKERERSFPSPSAMRNFLARFHDPEQEALRLLVPHTAFIPARLPALDGLMGVATDLLAFLQKHRPQATATLDMDATLVETRKKEALYCYKKFAAYQPLNTWWAEQGVVVRSEFRDGNVPAGFEQRRELEEALAMLPAGVERARMRSDTAGYQWDLLRYCEQGRSERFGRIEFAVGVDITEAFKRAIVTTPGLTWKPLGDSAQQWAEVCYVPEGLAATKKGAYRFIAVREPVRQLELLEDAPRQYSFPTLSVAAQGVPDQVYKLWALVTNRLEMPAPDVITWLRARCGKSEEAHSIMKTDLAGGQMPSGRFGANAAWWQAMILSLNLVALIKHLALDARWQSKRMKALRFGLVAVPARVIEHARALTIRVTGSAAATLLMEIRQRIRALAQAPAG